MSTPQKAFERGFGVLKEQRKRGEIMGIRTKKTYAEVVRNPSRVVNSNTHSQKSDKEKMGPGSQDWNNAVICVRESLWDEWSMIQSSLNGLHNTNLVLKPFQADKAMFCCVNAKEAERFAKQGFVKIQERVMIKLQCGDKKEASKTRKLSCTGGWIKIWDLPLKWWKQEVFKAIGR